jgi:hypothetical protein
MTRGIPKLPDDVWRGCLQIALLTFTVVMPRTMPSMTGFSSSRWLGFELSDRWIGGPGRSRGCGKIPSDI